MMNSGLTIDHARIIAEQLSSTESNFIPAAFETVLARLPTDVESERCQKFLDAQVLELDDDSSDSFTSGGTAKRSPSGDVQLRARENLVHVLLLHNDFVTVR
jgi:hypothetical protein